MKLDEPVEARATRRQLSAFGLGLSRPTEQNSSINTFDAHAIPIIQAISKRLEDFFRVSTPRMKHVPSFSSIPRMIVRPSVFAIAEYESKKDVGNSQRPFCPATS